MFLRGGLVRDIEKRCDDESSRSCRCLIRPHVKFDCLIFDETGADSHADTLIGSRLFGVYMVPPSKKLKINHL